MHLDFDRIIDRKNTNSLKYDFAAKRGKPPGLLPLWVADMDFQTCPEVIEALKRAAEHGIFGYSESREAYFNALHRWYLEHFGWATQPSWLVKTPGVVYAIATAVRAYTQAGDAVLIQQPVYYPFSSAVLDNGRKLVNNPLVYENGAYRIDFADFEAKIVENRVKLFVFCSPHNPVGRVWTREELEKVGEICLKHNVLVVSDEIHADFVYEGHRHLVFAGISPAFSDITITCTAPSKTFNLAGLQVSNIFISNQALRRRFRAEIGRSGYSQLNTLGLVACQAAYEHGEEWLRQLRVYLEGNLALIRDFLAHRLDTVRLVEPQGTYLAWLDFKALGLTEEQREDLIVNGAKLWLDSGVMFGQDGEGFERLNFACPRAVLEKALTQLEGAVRRL